MFIVNVREEGDSRCLCTSSRRSTIVEEVPIADIKGRKCGSPLRVFL